jgi:hypothetical protein
VSSGWEYDYLVLSTCRSVPREEVEVVPSHDWLERHLDRAADVHQINMAITRPRKGLVITGESLCDLHALMHNHACGHSDQPSTQFRLAGKTTKKKYQGST